MEEVKKTKHHELISIGRIWHQTWRIFSGHFLKFMAITIIPILIFNLIYWLGIGSTILSLDGLSNPLEFFNFSNGYFYFLIILLIMAIFINIIGAIALFVVAGKYNEYNIWAVFKKSVEFFWGFVWMSIIIGIIQLIGLIVGYLLLAAISSIIGLINPEIMKYIFDYLLIIPVIVVGILSIFLTFAPFCLILRGKNGWTSVKLSFKLIRGHFWAVVIRLFIAYIVVSLIMLSLGFIPAVGIALGALICLPFLIIYIMILFNNLYTLKIID